MAKLATLDSPQFSVLCSLCGNKSYGQLLGAQRRIKRRWKKPSLFSLSRHSTRHTHMLPSLSLPSISHHQPSTFFSPSFFLVVDGNGDRSMPTSEDAHCVGIPSRPMAGLARRRHGVHTDVEKNLPIHRCPRVATRASPSMGTTTLDIYAWYWLCSLPHDCVG